VALPDRVGGAHHDLITIPAALVYFLAQRHLISGLAAGGTKG
jgi:ABC-type maltose transport system permease subunit